MDDSERILDDFASSPQAIGPLEHMKKVLQQGGFCAPPPVGAAVAARAAADEPKGVGWVTNTGFDSAVPFHPIENLRKVLSGFCDPVELSKEHPASSDHSVLMARSYDSDDTAKLSNFAIVAAEEEEVVEEEEEEGSDKDETFVIVTEPGTGRSVRVMRALEIFLAAVLVLHLALVLLRQFGVAIEFQPNTSRHSSLLKVDF